jgi:hypothetical protein
MVDPCYRLPYRLEERQVGQRLEAREEILALRRLTAGHRGDVIVMLLSSKKKNSGMESERFCTKELVE